jgi:hypothetical protein
MPPVEGTPGEITREEEVKQCSALIVISLYVTMLNIVLPAVGRWHLLEHLRLLERCPAAIYIRPLRLLSSQMSSPLVLGIPPAQIARRQRDWVPSFAINAGTR